MTPLRQRFLDDMRIRNYSPRTIEAYVAAVARFAKHFNRSPDTLGADEVRTFQLHLLQKQTSWSQFNQIVSGLRLFYRLTLARPDLVVMLPYGKKPRTLPQVLSTQEVMQMLDAARPGLESVLLQTAYACGLRLSELIALRVDAIDSRRMLVQVRGKGQKDRLVPLSQRLLHELRGWWRHHRSPCWLFPGKTALGHVTDCAVQRMCQRVRLRAGLLKRLSMHTFCHNYATHLLEAGVDVVTVQRLLGHNDLRTTARYLHLSSRQLHKTPSLLDLLALPQPEAAPAAEGHS